MFLYYSPLTALRWRLPASCDVNAQQGGADATTLTLPRAPRTTLWWHYRPSHSCGLQLRSFDGSCRFCCVGLACCCCPRLPMRMLLGPQRRLLRSRAPLLSASLRGRVAAAEGSLLRRPRGLPAFLPRWLQRERYYGALMRSHGGIACHPAQTKQPTSRRNSSLRPFSLHRH